MISLTTGKAAPGFDHPLEMLHACHNKILRKCNTLKKLAEHLASKGCDQQAQQAAQAILRYFDTAGLFHHQDEEENLFPTLRTMTGSDQAQIEALLEHLLAEHIIMLSDWDELRGVLLQLADGVNTPLPDTLTEKFIRSYTKHITFEEVALLPLAARLLSTEQIMQIGKSMAERRGVKFPAIPAA